MQLHGNQSIQYCPYGEISVTAYLFVQLCIMTQYLFPKSGIHSCMWGYAVAVFYYLGMQLHGNQSIQYCPYGEISVTAYLFVQLCIMMT